MSCLPPGSNALGVSAGTIKKLAAPFFGNHVLAMALRATGKRNSTLRTAAIATAKRLAKSGNEQANWIARDALRELQAS